MVDRDIFARAVSYGLWVHIFLELSHMVYGCTFSRAVSWSMGAHFLKLSHIWSMGTLFC